MTSQTVHTTPTSESVIIGDKKATFEVAGYHKARSLSVASPELLLPRYPAPAADSIVKRHKTFNALKFINGWTVHYRTFRATARASRSFSNLAYFWAYLLAKALSTPDSAFDKSWVTFEQNQLYLELFNLDGPIPKEVVTELATVMMTYTARGFCGLFNAKISAPGYTIWASMYIKDGKT